jgi:hypothetical protein
MLEAQPLAPPPAFPAPPERFEGQPDPRVGWAAGLPTPADAGSRVGERTNSLLEDPPHSPRMVVSSPPAGHDPRVDALAQGHNGSGSLTPLPADDHARPPSAPGTGERPFLPPAAEGQLAHVERGLEPPAQEPPPAVDEDSEPTMPLPVILVGAASIPRPAQVETPRGPFEPAKPVRPISVTGSLEPPPPPHANGAPHAAGSRQDGTPAESGRSAVGSSSPLPDDLAQPPGPAGRLIPEAASAKLEQIKDLYLTAEAIGEDALDKHFEQVSHRQRELIKEFFDGSRPANADAP